MEFQLFMSMLNLTSIPKSVSGQAQLLEIASTMADLERPFDAADTEAVDKFVQCANAATEFFSVIKNAYSAIHPLICKDLGNSPDGRPQL